MRFTDEMINGMYSHNLTYIKQPVSDDKFCNIIESELKHNIDIGKTFLNVQFDFPYSLSMLHALITQPSEVTTYDYYLFQAERFEQLSARKDCVLQMLDNSILQQALELDLHANGDIGHDFVRRRFERRSTVYLQPGLVDNYICFSGSQAVGHCDLFISDGVAKIEDVDVAPDQQRKGYGTAMLREMIRIALGQGVTTIYLITDHDDTAKDMYEKCGFLRVSKKTEMLFKV